MIEADETRQAARDLVVVGTSAGGVEALSRLVKELPADLPAAVLVVLHVTASATSVLPEILSRAGSLPASHAQDGARIQHGRIYVAPPDRHLLVERGRLRVTHGPRENGHRPAIDPLFRSAAEDAPERVVGVVLSGTRDDGAAGLRALKLSGGVAIVQDPDDALYPTMPLNALSAADPEHVLPIARIAALIAGLAAGPGAPAADGASAVEPEAPRAPSAFSCPDCGGVLFTTAEGGVRRFRCRTGHGYSEESLLAAQSEALETALWVALRALEERAHFMGRMAARLRERGLEPVDFEARAREGGEQAMLLRELLGRVDKTLDSGAALAEEGEPA